MRTRPFRRCVCSTITTASAPAGMGAPVMISTACPGPTSPANRSPARTSPMTSQLARQVDGAHGIAVAHRARQRGSVAVGGNVFGQHASGCFIQPGFLRLWNLPPRACFPQHGFPSFRECQRRHAFYCTGLYPPPACQC